MDLELGKDTLVLMGINTAQVAKNLSGNDDQLIIKFMAVKQFITFTKRFHNVKQGLAKERFMNEHKKFQVSKIKEYIDQQYIPQLFDEEVRKQFENNPQKKVIKSIDDLNKEKAALYKEAELDEEGYG